MTRFDRKAQSQPKHKPTPASSASKAPRPPPVQRPGWSGPSYLHKKVRPKPTAPPTASDAGPGARPQPQLLPLELQRLVLDVFRDTFPASRDFDALKPTLHVINTALGVKDFETAFQTEGHREAYAVRWGPSRALCYANLLAGIVSSEASDQPWVANFLSGGEDVCFPARAVCLGGGAAEIMAFGALLRYLKPKPLGKSSPGTAEAAEDQAPRMAATEGDHRKGTCSLQLTLMDATDWASVIAKLERGLTTPPPLSKYASEAARAKNASLIDLDSLQVTSKHGAIFASTIEDLKAMIGPDAALITMFFTLHDLYAISVPRTAKLLVEVTIAAPKDSLLLVVDRPGNYSETGVGKDATGTEEMPKKIPMAWLIDRMLLGKDKKATKEEEPAGDEPGWEKLVGDECRLHRLEEGLEFPVSLENTKFQMHLFRRL